MSIKNFGGIVHIGTYNDHHKEVTFHVPHGTNPADLVRAFMSDNAEDIEPEDLSSNSPESNSGTASYFPYLTKKCFEQKHVDAVEAEIQAARKGTAEDMWRTLWNNENLGYLEVKFVDATTLYRAIEKWYGKLPYTERNFRGARSKR